MNIDSLKRPTLSIALYALIALTIVKMIATVFTTPLLGYANNYDFLRQSSCVGLWMSYPDKPSTAANPEAPINALVYDGNTRREVCMKSSDNLFPWLATRLHRIGAQVDFREVGLWKVASVLFLLFFLLAKTADRSYRCAIALAFFLVFGDLVNLLYVNTLYLEFSVIGGLFFSLLATILLISAPSKETAPVAMTVVTLLWLGFSKQQYMPLAVVLCTICSATLFLKHADRRRGIAVLLLALAMPFVYAKLNHDDSGHMKGVNFANKTDTFLGAVLPEATDKVAMLRKLGLPPTCGNGIGQNWYTPGLMDKHPCPEVERLSRARLIGVFIAEPATLLEPMRKAMLAVRPFYPDYLGHIEKGDDIGSPRYRLLQQSSLSHALMALPATAMPPVVFGSIFLGIAALAPIGISLRARVSPAPLVSMIFLGGLVALYSLFSAVFGDGYIELQKHAVGFLVGIACQIAATSLLLAEWLFTRALSPKTTAAPEPRV